MALHLPDRAGLIAGDAIVLLDPYRAKRGPRLVARAAVADVERNLVSLDALVATGATTVLTGHGEPWPGGIEAAGCAGAQRGVGVAPLAGRSPLPPSACAWTPTTHVRHAHNLTRRSCLI